MKDYYWLAVFSTFTLVVGGLFTYGNGVLAKPEMQPVQVYVVSTSTPSFPVVVQGPAPQPITITLPEITVAPPEITVNISIATSSLSGTEQVAETPSSSSSTEGSSYTYYVSTTNNYSSEAVTEEPVATTTPEVPTVTLSIGGVYEATTTPITSGQTVFELLTYLDSIDPALELKTEDYGEMGVLVTAMGGFVNGTDGNYWQYMVNGESPMVGAAQYELEDEDVIVWEFKGF